MEENTTPTQQETTTVETPAAPTAPDHTQELNALRSENETLKQSIAQMQNDLRASQISTTAMGLASSLNVDVATMPYVIKLADLSQVVDDKGKLNEQSLNDALSAVLEKVPGLKRSENQMKGITPIAHYRN